MTLLPITVRVDPFYTNSAAVSARERVANRQAVGVVFLATICPPRGSQP